MAKREREQTQMRDDRQTRNCRRTMQTTAAALAVVDGPPAKLPPSSSTTSASVAAAVAAAGLKTSPSMRKIVDCDGVSSTRSYASSDLDGETLKLKSRIFPSTRFFMALLLCLCFVSRKFKDRRRQNFRTKIDDAAQNTLQSSFCAQRLCQQF